MPNALRFPVVASLTVLVAIAAAAPAARAEVTRVQITQRADLQGSAYEKIVGTVYFSVDPANGRNKVIADLDKAPKNPAGRVEFSADLYVLRPKDPARSNGVTLVDVLNRGNKVALRSFNQATGGNDPKSVADLGGGYLTAQGFTIVWVGWEFSASRQGVSMGIDAPRARGVSTIVRGDLTPTTRDAEQTVTDLAGYAPADSGGPDTALTVRDGPFGAATPIPADRWRLRGNTVTLTGGFEPGRTYQLSYRVVDPPVVGAGLLALRDVGAWVRTSSDIMPAARYAYAFGASQSGRFLREFLYDGCNTDERGAKVFDFVWPHIAGAGRLDVNARGSTPTSLTMFTNAIFPFANAGTRDPISGRVEGLIDNPRAREHQPKMFFTNTSTEYWGGGRSAALIHTTPDGKADLAVAENTRIYFLTGAPHYAPSFPPRTTTGQQPENPLEVWPVMRALFVAMDEWVRKGVAPPRTQIPRLADGTLVPIDRTMFPAIPGVTSPKTIHAGRQEGKPLPLLVPKFDEDGNEIAGIRLPSVAVPVATYTGWNFRNASAGATGELVPLMGTFTRLPKTNAERLSTKDPRRSIAERYASREAFLDGIRKWADRLVKDRYLLSGDIPWLLRRAEDEWAN